MKNSTEERHGHGHTSSNLNLLGRGRHFGFILVHYDGGHGGLTDRNAFDQEHSRVELGGLGQRSAEKRPGRKSDARLANWCSLKPQRVSTYVSETMEEAALSFSFMNSK